MRPPSPPSAARWLAAAAVVVLPACDGVAVDPPSSGGTECDIPTGGFAAGPARDVIPALTDPPVVSAGSVAASYLDDDDRVIAVLSPRAPLAVPLRILRNHEVANLEWDGRSLAVTYCPNTGSSLAFHRRAVGDAEFGVSGLLLHDNLIMYDRRGEESLWPQMSRAARCGPSRGVPLESAPVVEARWGRWRALRPDTRVVADLGAGAPASRAGRAPLGAQAGPAAERRVLGIPRGDGLALPFERLDDGSPARAVEVRVDGAPVVVLWDRSGRAAMAFDPRIGGEARSFRVEGGRIVDAGSGSVWTVDGRAVEGPLAGQRLRPVASAYVAYRSAWIDFHPETRIWSPGPGDVPTP